MNKRIVGKENFSFHNLNLFLFWLDRAAGLRPMKEGLLLTWVQCDQIGWFLKVLDDMVTIKSSPNAWWSIGLKWKATLSCGYILANFWKNFGVLFNLASGHSCWRDLYRPLKFIGRRMFIRKKHYWVERCYFTIVIYDPGVVSDHYMSLSRTLGHY